MFKHCLRPIGLWKLPLKPEAQPRVLMEASKAQEVLNKCLNMAQDIFIPIHKYLMCLNFKHRVQHSKTFEYFIYQVHFLFQTPPII